ncbi:MAG: helix-turn-helix domain-containing protein [Lachnospiraceae bacterium]|nr:helix-turn-helix domain-containing protein [Lachnospiraceae bacterium]
MHNVDVIATSEKIKQLMQEKNISVKDISEYTGLSLTAVYKWLNGSALPSYEPAEDLVELFGLDRIEDLIILTKPG